jgi:TRAP-type C4-dicarboxylate transport system substrate-binding protein
MTTRGPLLLALVAALALAACGSQGPGRAGGPAAPVVLRMATINGESGYNPAVDDLPKRVDTATNGNVKIEMSFAVGEFGADAEQLIVQGVASGAYDLGVVGTRVFDTLGVDAFSALDTPFLIDSYPLEAAVIASDIPARMLASLEPLHVAGLGLLADGLRHPTASEQALLSPADWHGLGFGVFRSRTIASSIRALGAEPVEAFGPARQAALSDGRIHAFEMSLQGYRLLNLRGLAPYITPNVSLWPQLLAVIANPARIAALDSAQRAAVEGAVHDAEAGSTALVDHEAALVGELCDDGVRMIAASDDDLAALREAVAPARADIARDPVSGGFIQQIEGLKAAVKPTAFTIPSGCGDAAGAPSDPPPPSAPPKTTANTTLDGTWTVTFTDQDVAEAKEVDVSEVRPGSGGTFVVSFDRGDMIGPAKTGEAISGLTYTVAGDTITIYAPDASMGGAQPPPGPAAWTYRWSVFGDTLTFQKLGGIEPGCSLELSGGKCEPSVFIIKPWHRA